MPNDQRLLQTLGNRRMSSNVGAGLYGAMAAGAGGIAAVDPDPFSKAMAAAAAAAAAGKSAQSYNDAGAAADSIDVVNSGLPFGGDVQSQMMQPGSVQSGMMPPEEVGPSDYAGQAMTTQHGGRKTLQPTSIEEILAQMPPEDRDGFMQYLMQMQQGGQ